MAVTSPTAVQPATPTTAPTRRQLWRRRGTKAAPYAFIAPFFVFFAAFGLFPLIYTGYVSLHRVQLQNPDAMSWVGFDNYTTLLKDEFFWNSLKNTFTIGVISTVPQLCLALGLAHLLNYRLRGRTFFRVALLLPYATSVAAATLVFAGLFGRDYGMLNWFLGLVGVDPIDWFNEKWPSQIAISTIVTWRWTGYNTLIYLAAMQAIPRERYEAAMMDGARRWQQFRHVTLPGLRPTIIFTIIVSTIGALQIFGEPLLLQGGTTGMNGGASRQYQTTGLYMYQTGWQYFSLGKAAAIAWLLFLVIVLVIGVNAAIARYRAKSAAGKLTAAKPPNGKR
ncbi:carbohydrate ABC transporter permease [Yinghuangia sp. YIM S09857]|uniref:carbohydrate ABC transporter permease n=1 Tax=Yinghuangia sp. YIM S09857 TaxID=3436929 RepID=UPI003F5362FE